MPQTLRDGPWRDCPRGLGGETGGDSVKVQDPQCGNMSRDNCRSQRIASSVGLNHHGLKGRSSICVGPEDRGSPPPRCWQARRPQEESPQYLASPVILAGADGERRLDPRRLSRRSSGPVPGRDGSRSLPGACGLTREHRDRREQRRWSQEQKAGDGVRAMVVTPSSTPMCVAALPGIREIAAA